MPLTNPRVGNPQGYTDPIPNPKKRDQGYTSTVSGRLSPYQGYDRKPSKPVSTPYADRAQSAYASEWASQLANSQYAPQYAALRSDTEAQWENLRLSGLEQNARNAAGRSNAALANRGVANQLQGDRDAYQRARERGAVANAGTAIDEGYLARQKGYLSDMLNYAQRGFNLDQEVQNVDLGAVERQFPLLQKEREDLGVLHQNLIADLGARGVTATKDERLKQLDLVAQAAASGGAGAALPTARAQRTAEQLQEELAANERARIEGETNYQAALRKNDENQAQARDAKEKIRFEKERIELERQRAERESFERELQRQDEEKRKTLERFYTAISLQQAADQLRQQQVAAFIATVQNNQARQQAAFIAEIQRQQQVAAFIATVQQNKAREDALRSQAAAGIQSLAQRAPSRGGYPTAAQTRAHQGR